MQLLKFAALTAVLMLTTSATACNSMSQEAKQMKKIEWNLSKSHTSQDVGWPADNTSDFYALQGEFLVTLKLPGDKVFSERVTLINFYRSEGELLSSIHLHINKQDTDEVYRKAQSLVEYWQLNKESLNDWYRRRKQNERELDDRFQTLGNDLRPARSLEILHSFNDEKPWYILFGVSFTPP